MLGKNNKEQGNLIILDFKTTDADRKPIKPGFSIRKKNAETGQYEVLGNESEFYGRLKTIVTKVKEYKNSDGKVIDSKEVIDLYFADDELNETYLVPLSYRIATRGFFNRLLALETFDNLKVLTFRDDKGYEALVLYQNGVVVKGKYTKENLPKPEEFTRRGKTERIYDQVDAFFKEKLNDLAERVKPNIYAKVSEPAPVKVAAATSNVNRDEDEIDF